MTASAARAEPRFVTHMLRALGVVAVSAALALVTNAFCPRPVPLLAADGPGALPERALRISADDFRELLAARKASFLLDVRTAMSFRTAHAPDAVNAPADAFLQHYQELGLQSKLTAAEEIVLICEADDCPSADRVAKLLKEVGHPNIRVLYGGWSAYVKGGFPVEGAR
jgi:3-mercaptopyruvate sulfurtransferase SseA